MKNLAQSNAKVNSDFQLMGKAHERELKMTLHYMEKAKYIWERK